MTTRTLRLLAVAALASGLTACTTVRLENSRRLASRPDFDDARAAAPEWCRDALKTIDRLEHELERR